MKQDIILQVRNDTGIEFEKEARLGKPSDTDWFVFDGEIMQAKNCLGIYPILTPKIDHELESAKKKFPVGSYFKTDYPDYDDFILPVTSVENRGGLGVNIWSGKNGRTSIPCPVDRCTPFPLPVWRCCESDKPKKDGTQHVRDKGNHYIKGVYQYNLETKTWNGMLIPSRLEWLDEGER